MRIVYNRYDGGVSICSPTDWILSVMSCGGLWGERPRGFLDRQIVSMVARGVPEYVAHRYANAVMFGGCTTAEAYEIIRDRDCHNGLAHELWDASDIPQDRWFRDAWRRSHNGGPIYINLEYARPIQMRHIAEAIRQDKIKRENELLASPYSTADFRERVLAAGSLGELRMVGQEIFARNQKTA